jgi:hypothetical protein
MRRSFGHPCLLPAHAPDALPLHAVGNGTVDTLPWMHAANGRDACTTPPAPTLPGRAHNACMQLTRLHAAAAPVHALLQLLLARCCYDACWPCPACCCGTHAPAPACGGCLASRTHKGTTSVCTHFSRLVIQHLQHKSICCKIRSKRMKHL